MSVFSNDDDYKLSESESPAQASFTGLNIEEEQKVNVKKGDIVQVLSLD